MEFVKKVLVLKQITDGYSVGGRPLSGIIRMEIENGVATAHFTLINFIAADGGTYLALLVDSKKNCYSFDLGKRPSSFTEVLSTIPDLKKGFAVGVALVKNDLPVTVAFSRSDGFELSATDLKKLMAEKCLETRKTLLKNAKENPLPHAPDDAPNAPSPVKPPYPTSPFPDPEITPPDEFNTDENSKLSAYNDEAVATENYYAFDKSINEKLIAIRGFENENGSIENELPFNRRAQEEIESAPNAYCTTHEAHAHQSANADTPRPFYSTVSAELQGIFLKFPEEEGLMKMFSDSKFCKIHYSKDKYYVVGLIKEDGKEKYICYGVPGKYSPEPPKELKGFCSFIPLSVFDLSGDGYWMMFQDAVTGSCIKLDQTVVH